jgi:Fur family transcriptional regulator, peroxide stress response regulator
LKKIFSPEIIKQKIFDAGLKVTHQRMVVLEAILIREDHPTAELIYEAIRPENPIISLGTVYKTLDVFVSVGLLQKVYSDEGVMRYDANLKSHNHVHCTNTNEIIDFHNEELNKMISEYFSTRKVENLLIKEIRLQISGEKIDPEKEISI